MRFAGHWPSSDYLLNIANFHTLVSELPFNVIGQAAALGFVKLSD